MFKNHVEQLMYSKENMMIKNNIFQLTELNSAIGTITIQSQFIPDC